MKLDKIYSLRERFSVIGLTGRTGSGCSRVAVTLSQDFRQLKLRNPTSFKSPSDFSRKYKIVHHFASKNWKKYHVINYKDVVLLLLIPYGAKAIVRELNFWYPSIDKPKVSKTVEKIFKRHNKLIIRIKSLPVINEQLKDDDKLTELGKIYFEDGFLALASEFYRELNKIDIYARLIFSHRVSNNLRAFGKPISKYKDMVKNYTGYNIDNIYTVAEAINRVIKGLKNIDSDVHVVIDSLRNSIELLFFKERYSAFYMVALNSNTLKSNIEKSISPFVDQKRMADVVDQILELDETEYSDKDFKIGEFFSPDIQNCIQKSDIHINTDSIKIANLKNDPNWFANIDEHLIKYTSLIQHPGVITPNAFERCMQVAYNAKYNSGCISRQVGAVITDKNYSIKAIGWNDVPQGSVPCLVRSASDYLKKNGPTDKFAYSEFERDSKSVNVGKVNFRKEFAKHYESKLTKVDLKGRSCSFCFKATYNAFEGNDNQVHTRSLHAEENAMLQISKYGGVALNQGNLFTTASPCELCSKKAFQLGVKNIYYIDPYPGIANSHILRGGFLENQPRLLLFSGAVGRAYHKLYEPFMAYKDELNMLTEIELPMNIDKGLKQLTKSEGFSPLVRNQLTKLQNNGGINGKMLSDIIEKGLKSKK